MPTSYYGGQGAPSYNEGEFTVRYSLTTDKGNRKEKDKVFDRYDEAKAFYDSIDDSAAIWDTTRYAELCEAKTRMAYYSALLQSRSNKSTIAVHTVASELTVAKFAFTRNLRGSGWKLLPDSIQELTEEEYEQLDPANHIEVVVPRR